MRRSHWDMGLPSRLALLMTLAGCMQGGSTAEPDHASPANDDDTLSLSDLGASCELDVVRTGHGPDSAFLRIAISNGGDKDLRILPYGTPFDANSNALIVRPASGEPAPYAGRIVDRVEPTDRDYTLIKPGETRHADYALLRQYAASAAGEYAAQIRHRWFEVKVGDDASSQLVRSQCNVARFMVEEDDLWAATARHSDAKASLGEITDADGDVDVTWSALSIRYRGCNTDQVNQIIRAATMIQDRFVLAAAGPYIASGTPEYVRWFGSYDGDRANHLKLDFAWSYQQLANNAFVYECEPDPDICDGGVIAHVDPFWDSETINLCPMFFGIVRDRKTQTQTLAHEISHFAPFDTDDNTYYSGNSIDLAKRDASDAAFNGDNFGYFIEEIGLSEPLLSSAAWTSDHLDVVGRTFAGVITHLQWDQTHWNFPNNDWARLGGGTTSAPKLVSWGPSRLDVFVRGDDRGYWHKWNNGTTWSSSWENLGGQFLGPPAVISQASNTLDIFGIGTDGAMWHKAWTGTAWSPKDPANWQSLGGAFFATQPAIVSWGPDELAVFAIGSNNRMYMKSWFAGQGWAPAGKVWTELGTREFMGVPSAVSLGSRRWDVFAKGTDGAVYRMGWWNEGWYPSGTTWEPVGGRLLGSPVAVKTHASRIDVFGIGTDGGLWQRTFDDTLRSWSPSWQSLGGAGLGAASGVATPTAVSWGPNRFDLFLPDGNLQGVHKAWGRDLGYAPSKTGFEYLPDNGFGGWLSF